MIVVDSSALMAILLQENAAAACADCLLEADVVLISAATLAEALIVAHGRGLGSEMTALIEAASLQVVAVDEQSARKVADAYRRWGKGAHPAALNYGDCFAYALAGDRGAPLLYVGMDFRATDIRSALEV